MYLQEGTWVVIEGTLPLVYVVSFPKIKIPRQIELRVIFFPEKRFQDVLRSFVEFLMKWRQHKCQ